VSKAEHDSICLICHYEVVGDAVFVGSWIVHVDCVLGASPILMASIRSTRLGSPSKDPDAGWREARTDACGQARSERKAVAPVVHLGGRRR
jgi:hypothetical protein